jgi:hypothetical protein
VTGGNLFQITLIELGDARVAWRIAALNNLLNFWIVGSVRR